MLRTGAHTAQQGHPHLQPLGKAGHPKVLTSASNLTTVITIQQEIEGRMRATRTESKAGQWSKTAAAVVRWNHACFVV
ncbi:hypothetical protein E2C01_088100 [Portunus trituberculatus]|uniref:Uncharacterized protein n=1 Tax=Portunus trituberculatus TaxID=210409 RepID=A0A5B7JL16_PORTR|nr:hypothetical protein [Portunus trituberculatus]